MLISTVSLKAGGTCDDWTMSHPIAWKLPEEAGSGRSTIEDFEVLLIRRT